MSRDPRARKSTRTERLQVRLTKAEVRTMRRGAKLSRRSVAEFVRWAIGIQLRPYPRKQRKGMLTRREER
jgi:hypothetical protein